MEDEKWHRRGGQGQSESVTLVRRLLGILESPMDRYSTSRYRVTLCAVTCIRLCVCVKTHRFPTLDNILQRNFAENVSFNPLYFFTSPIARKISLHNQTNVTRYFSVIFLLNFIITSQKNLLL